MKKLTVCARDCYDSCLMEFELDSEAKIIKVKGGSHPITQNFLCKRGHAEIKRIYSKERIKQPYLKQNNKFIPITWDEAIKTFADKIKYTISEFGSKSILYLTYDGNAGLIHNQYVHRIWHKLEATLTDMAICTTTGHKILKLHFGESNGLKPNDLPGKKLIVFWGMNAATTGPHIWHFALKAKNNGAKIITIDPIQTPTANHSHLWIRPKPGTDTALALFIINYIIQQNAYDLNFIQKYTVGFEHLKNQAKQWDINKTANFTSIPKEQLLTLAQSYIKLRPSATMIGVALQKKDFGWEHIRAIAFIQAILGMHRHFFYSNGQAYYIDYDYITGAKFHKTPNIIPQVATAEYIADGHFKLVVISSMNPAQTITNTKDFINGLKRPDVFTVVMDTHWSETAKLANLVLPVPTFVEKEDVIVSWAHNFTRYSKPVIPPLFNSKTEVEIMHLLAKQLNLTDWWLFQKPIEAIQIAMKNALLEQNELDLNGNIQQLKTKPLNYYPTDSGKIEFFSNKAQKLGLSPVPQQPTYNTQNKFILLSTAIPENTNSQFRDVFGQPKPEIHINPKDAQKLNINNNDVIQIYNEQDKLTFKAKISNKPPKGTIWAPRAIKDLYGKPLNNLITSKYQQIGKGPKFHSTTVNIKKL